MLCFLMAALWKDQKKEKKFFVCFSWADIHVLVTSWNHRAMNAEIMIY